MAVAAILWGGVLAPSSSGSGAELGGHTLLGCFRRREAVNSLAGAGHGRADPLLWIVRLDGAHWSLPGREGMVGGHRHR